MFDIGWLELMVIGIVALIVVGPKDLPGMFRTVGNFVGKARGMAREFQRTMEAAADESGLKEATETMKGLNDPLKQAQNSMKDYSKNFVSQKDQKAADAKAETAGDKLVKEATAVASPAAKATAPKADVGDAASVVAPKAKAAAKKAPAKKPAAKTKTAAKAKTAAKPKAAPKAKTVTKAAKKPAASKTKSG